MRWMASALPDSRTRVPKLAVPGSRYLQSVGSDCVARGNDDRRGERAVGTIDVAEQPLLQAASIHSRSSAGIYAMSFDVPIRFRQSKRKASACNRMR